MLAPCAVFGWSSRGHAANDAALVVGGRQLKPQATFRFGIPDHQPRQKPNRGEIPVQEPTITEFSST